MERILQGKGEGLSQHQEKSGVRKAEDLFCASECGQLPYVPDTEWNLNEYLLNKGQN